jgi:hypothetical protein
MMPRIHPTNITNQAGCVKKRAQVNIKIKIAVDVHPNEEVELL